jgi:hypothetical protein
MLFCGVKNSQRRLVAKHIWLKFNDEFKELQLAFGDIAEFEGTVITYDKGTVEHSIIREDWTISYPVSPVKIGLANF